MSAPRQASYIHVFGGGRTLADAVEEGRRRFETTSPSYPILGGLELARKHAFEEGEKLFNAAIQRAERLREDVGRLASYAVLLTQELVGPYVSIDPLRVSLDFSRVTNNGRLMKQHLLDHGVYVNRVTDRALLVNVHIGVTDEGIERLLQALATFAVIGRRLDGNLIAYPPGRALAGRGDRVTRALLVEVARLLSSGVNVHSYCAVGHDLVHTCNGRAQRSSD